MNTVIDAILGTLFLLGGCAVLIVAAWLGVMGIIWTWKCLNKIGRKK